MIVIISNNLFEYNWVLETFMKLSDYQKIYFFCSFSQNKAVKQEANVEILKFGVVEEYSEVIRNSGYNIYYLFGKKLVIILRKREVSAALGNN